LNWPAVGWVTTTLASVNTFPPPTGTSDTGPSTVPPLLVDADALDDGAELAAEVGAVPAGAELLLEPASPLPPQAARMGALAPASAAIAAHRSTDRRSRRLSPASGAGCGAVDRAIVSSLIGLMALGLIVHGEAQRHLPPFRFCRLGRIVSSPVAIAKQPALAGPATTAAGWAVAARGAFLRSKARL
jgi:hypothetical protein